VRTVDSGWQSLSMEKTCSCCGETRPIGDYPKTGARCKPCVYAKNAAWRALHRDKMTEYRIRWEGTEKAKASKKAYQQKNKDKAKERQRAWTEKNRAYVNEQSNIRAEKRRRAAGVAPRKFVTEEQKRERERKWRQENVARCNAYSSWVRSNRVNATPKWANREAISKIYAYAKHLDGDGVKHHVDHIVPLQGKTVCGLHVENNLRVVVDVINLRKNAKLIDEFAPSALENDGFIEFYKTITCG
jgi:hypothetical protein